MKTAGLPGAPAPILITCNGRPSLDWGEGSGSARQASMSVNLADGEELDPITVAACQALHPLGHGAGNIGNTICYFNVLEISDEDW